MSLLNCKVEFKLKWAKHCVSLVLGAENDAASFDNISFTIKDTKYAEGTKDNRHKRNQKLSKLVSKGS